METARMDWDAVIAAIRNNPNGYNFDFSTYLKIIGMVCTSSVFYAPLSVMTPSSPDGVRIMSVNELKAWLDTGSR
jgi:hypothetical protein